MSYFSVAVIKQVTKATSRRINLFRPMVLEEKESVIVGRQDRRQAWAAESGS